MQDDEEIGCFCETRAGLLVTQSTRGRPRGWALLISGRVGGLCGKARQGKADERRMQHNGSEWVKRVAMQDPGIRINRIEVKGGCRRREDEERM